MEKNVKVKLVRHQWDDEVKDQKKKRTQNIILISAIVVSFVLGVLFSNTIKLPVKGSNFETLEAVYQIMNKDWFFGKENPNLSEELMESAIRGMVNGQGDIHTSFMSKDEMKQFSSALETSFVGIGVRYVEIEEGVMVTEVIDFTPAQKSGVQAGDIIIKVDGVDVSTMENDDLPNAIKGEPQTDVVITIKRQTEVFDMTITRDEIYTSVSSRVVDGVGHIKITTFGTTTAKELENHIEKLNEQNVDNIILDFRKNGGGYLSALIDMASLFMEPNTDVIRQEYRDGKIEVGRTTGGNYKFDKIVVLVDEGSASASEVFAAAMREQMNTQIVGVTTYGKGTVQVSRTFPDGSALKYTIAAWLTPHGKSIEGVGIVPDLEVKLHDALYLNFFAFETDEQYKYDSVSLSVSSMQKILDFLGYDVSRSDGYFDSKTVQALNTFKGSVNLPQDGILDYETSIALNSAITKEWGINRDNYDTQLKEALNLFN